MTLPDFFTNKLTPQKKAQGHEKRTAKRLGGRQTINSGSLSFDKADVCVKGSREGIKNLRVELKRTDKESIILKKAWFDKLEIETKPGESWALELEIQDRQVVCISKDDFDFYVWFLMRSPEQIIEGLREGENNV